MDTTAIPHPGTPISPARSFAWRLALVGLTQLVLLEILNQLFVHWRESTAELWTMAFTGALLAVMVWVAWPIFRRTRSFLMVIPTTILLFFGLGAFDIFYNLHLRPNLGLYREDEWVAQHPGFQWGWRQGLAQKLWHKPYAPPFGAEKELVVSTDAKPQLASLAQVFGTAFSLSEIPKSAGGWDKITAQNVADFWILDKNKSRANAALHLRKSRSGLFVFRTREGKMGLLEILDSSDNPAGIKLRYKFLQQGPVSGTV